MCDSFLVSTLYNLQIASYIILAKPKKEPVRLVSRQLRIGLDTRCAHEIRLWDSANAHLGGEMRPRVRSDVIFQTMQNRDPGETETLQRLGNG